jgi:hypothetical protein
MNLVESFPVQQEDNGPYRDAAFLVAFPNFLEDQFKTTLVDDMRVAMNESEKSNLEGGEEFKLQFRTFISL